MVVVLGWSLLFAVFELILGFLSGISFKFTQLVSSKES